MLFQKFANAFRNVLLSVVHFDEYVRIVVIVARIFLIDGDL